MKEYIYFLRIFHKDNAAKINQWLKKIDCDSNALSLLENYWRADFLGNEGR